MNHISDMRLAEIRALHSDEMRILLGRIAELERELGHSRAEVRELQGQQSLAL